MKTYMIVTNDEFETPVKHDLKGAVQVAEYLVVSLELNRISIRNQIAFPVHEVQTEISTF